MAQCEPLVQHVCDERQPSEIQLSHLRGQEQR